MSNWNDPKFTDVELAEILSDYHKDVHGCRLNMLGEPRDQIISALESLDHCCEIEMEKK
jgi:hypothetical protein